MNSANSAHPKFGKRPAVRLCGGLCKADTVDVVAGLREVGHALTHIGVTGCDFSFVRT